MHFTNHSSPMRNRKEWNIVSLSWMRRSYFRRISMLYLIRISIRTSGLSRKENKIMWYGIVYRSKFTFKSSLLSLLRRYKIVHEMSLQIAFVKYAFIPLWMRFTYHIFQNALQIAFSLQSYSLNVFYKSHFRNVFYGAHSRNTFYKSHPARTLNRELLACHFKLCTIWIKSISC